MCRQITAYPLALLTIRCHADMPDDRQLASLIVIISYADQLMPGETQGSGKKWQHTSLFQNDHPRAVALAKEFCTTYQRVAFQQQLKAVEASFMRMAAQCCKASKGTPMHWVHLNRWLN